MVDCDHCYVQGQKSFGHRLTSKYSNCRFLKRRLTHYRVLKSIKEEKPVFVPKNELFQHLYNFLCSLKIDYNGAIKEIQGYPTERYNSCLINIEKIKSRDFFLGEDDYGRLHTNLTNLKSTIRKYLTHSGHHLSSIDVSNSQPLFLLKILLDYSNTRCGTCCTTCTVQDPEFIEQDDVKMFKILVENGTFYSFLMQRLNIDNKRTIKKFVFREILFGEGVSKEFHFLFPNVARILQEMKLEDDYRQVAWTLQRAESKLMIGGVCGRLMREFPEMFIATIHDSILTLPEHADAVNTL